MPGALKTEAVVLRSLQVRRGRSDPPSLHAPARPDRRDRQGGAARQEPLRRAPGTLLSPANGALRGPQRTAHRDERRHDHRPRAAPGARPRARQRRARLRRRRRGCSRRPIRILACSRCCATSSPCSTPAPSRPAWPISSRSGSSSCSPPASRRSSPPAPSCGEADHLAAFSGAAGGVVCSACEATGFKLGEEAHAFMTGALGAALADVPAAGEQALRQAERAIADTVEHHAHVRWRSASAALDRRL